ncbi:MAG: hypothetical protein EAZ21_00140 [Betaproteobacteria bacterium]|nr:MAG: hypothetical protein EAZ43_08995 [Betaproteobacteria bacterium]TAG84677.1 MAG: hypothetical protein EAZ21_00140 [Betaproteobacteria bacterium]
MFSLTTLAAVNGKKSSRGRVSSGASRKTDEAADYIDTSHAHWLNADLCTKLTRSLIESVAPTRDRSKS